MTKFSLNPYRCKPSIISILKTFRILFDQKYDFLLGTQIPSFSAGFRRVPKSDHANQRAAAELYFNGDESHTRAQHSVYTSFCVIFLKPLFGRGKSRKNFSSHSQEKHSELAAARAYHFFARAAWRRCNALEAKRALARRRWKKNSPIRRRLLSSDVRILRFFRYAENSRGCLRFSTAREKNVDGGAAPWGIYYCKVDLEAVINKEIFLKIALFFKYRMLVCYSLC